MSLLVSNAEHAALSYSEDLGKSVCAQRTGAYDSDLIFRELEMTRATALDQIISIVSMIPQIQMFWVYTQRIIARMQYPHAIWDGSAMHNPCGSMSENLRFGYLEFPSNIRGASSFDGPCSMPHPASRSWIKLPFPIKLNLEALGIAGGIAKLFSWVTASKVPAFVVHRAHAARSMLIDPPVTSINFAHFHVANYRGVLVGGQHG